VGEGKWLFESARRLPPNANIVEIGSFEGRSTCCLAAACRGTEKRVFAIDTFDGGSDLPRCNSFPAFSKNLKRCGLESYVEPIKCLSTQVAKTWNKPIHLLFVDGSHYYEEVLADFSGFFPRVVGGGIVAFHDVDETKPGVLRAWNEFFKNQLTEVGHCERVGYGRKPEDNSRRFCDGSSERFGG
jgi:predicted O-methyltransferase YrrM